MNRPTAGYTTVVVFGETVAENRTNERMNERRIVYGQRKASRRPLGVFFNDVTDLNVWLTLLVASAWWFHRYRYNYTNIYGWFLRLACGPATSFSRENSRVAKGKLLRKKVCDQNFSKLLSSPLA